MLGLGAARSTVCTGTLDEDRLASAADVLVDAVAALEQITDGVAAQRASTVGVDGLCVPGVR
jgi:hypothetical protein